MDEEQNGDGENGPGRGPHRGRGRARNRGSGKNQRNQSLSARTMQYNTNRVMYRAGSEQSLAPLIPSLLAMPYQRGQPPQLQYHTTNRANNTYQRPNNHARSTVRPEHHNNDSVPHNHNRPKKPTNMGFIMLQNLAKSESKEIISQINDKREAFMNLLQSPIERLDVYALVLELLAKVCQSSFDQLKLTILLDVCNSPFILSLRNYLMDLPYSERKSANNMYWKNPNEFWVNFLTFCECITTLSPSIALAKCRSLIDGTSKLCLEALGERHDYKLPENCDLTLIKLREALTTHEKEKTVTGEQRKKPNVDDEEQEPPESFRQLCVIPRRGDLIEERPFLRSNVVKGGYRDVEHYLDVQFRLFREDCFGPLREGILQFIRDPTKRKYDHIRVFRNVKFVQPYVSSQKVGAVVEFDEATKKRFKKMNWAHNKRFIFGSLVIFTKDNCKNLVVATILDRDVKYLDKGKIPVSMVDVEVGDDLYKNETYTMIESEVYFEPYYHVLKAMQEPSFPNHIAMKKYIIDVNPEPQPAKYVDENRSYTVETELNLRAKFKVLDFDTWPSSEEMNLNESQYEAYKMALTHEFAVIQGPPGTGKTYLGVKVAKTLIENLRCTAGSLLLLVCYTNHALDQFLEAILPITDSIVRVGGQSRNEAMEKINLNTIRKTAQKTPNSSRRLFFEQRQNLKECILKLKTAQECIESLNTSVLSHNCIRSFVPESIIIGDFHKRSNGNFKDPLYCWLFENVVYDFNEPITLEGEDTGNPNNNGNDQSDNRQEITLDDLETENLSSTFDMNIQSCFSIEKAQEQLKYLTARYWNSKSRQEQYDLHREIIITRSLIRTFKEMRNYHRQGVEVSKEVNLRNPSRIDPVDRWMLYFKWTNYVANDLREKVQPLQDTLKRVSAEYEESRMIVDYELLKNYKVIGMTTSGAARLRKLIQALAPPIVIVEEAAEVLEQHIITSLTKKCQHLILIGDHQQLRPSASYLRLAKHYNIEVSLFERMILNDMHSRRLAVQHRMRPQIAALIAPAIYPDLQNHPSVEDFPNVRGVTCNVFFYTHDHKEQVIDDSASKTNENEGDMVLGLANYLMQQDYQPEDVTILAAYSGQMFYMKKQRFKYSHLSKVKITVVDNYQGEESKIILLSLVRNNDDNKIGFLAIENRVCVALSRAKEGFYIFGNIEILKSNSPLWTKVAATLEGFGALGTSIRLMCENHSSQISVISTDQDFNSKVPEGGCLLKCNYNLPCGHACPLMCHGYDRGHINTKCTLKCERILCELNHVCPLKCVEECKPCQERVVKKLPCGHNMSVFCHVDPNDPKVRCLTVVPAKLPICGHEVKKSCYMATEKVKCPVPCEYRVDKCGHVCMRTCHVTEDPHHERYLCQKPCAKAKKGCTMEFEGDRGDHQCVKRCHEECDECNVEVDKKRQSCKHKVRVACSKSPDEKPCYKKCARALACGHFCTKKCFEVCGKDCKQIVKKTIPECGHEITLECGLEPDRRFCKTPCELTMSCGHRCRGRCGDPCDPTKCKELTPRYYASPCGHKVQLPCHVVAASDAELKPELLLKYCAEPCGKELECGHACVGTCARCRQGRLHEPCARPCHQLNICGHQCMEPCNQVCPPCRKPCEVKCQHSRCRRECGAPCVPCQEQCSRACPHVTCKRRCGETCALAACTQPCARALSCGHPCRGLCGERCPDVCKLCRPEQFPTDFLGDQFDDDALFIVLEDCGHVMEFENMENLMKGKSDLIAIHRCPYCRAPIINTPRYKDLVNRMLREDINPIKERVYGNAEKIIARRAELHETVANFHNVHSKIYNDPLFSHWKKAFEQMILVVKSKRKCSLLQLEMYFVYLNILELLSDVHKKYTSLNLIALQDSLIDQNKMICRVLVKNVHKISQQQQADIDNEIKRTNAIVNLAIIISHPSYLASQTVSQVTENANAAKKVIFKWGIYEHDKATEAINELQKSIKVSGIVSKAERELIIKAIGAKAGQWFKCPNGHFYSIGQCGGAMEVSKCLECKAEIGGTNHRLLSSNQHAREFDNSRFPAYSEEANNLANFDLANIV